MMGAMNRYHSWKKAIRKRNIDRNVRQRWSHSSCGDWYDNLHEYSKGKIHCSCGLCAAKTRKHGSTVTDIRKIQRLEYTD